MKNKLKFFFVGLHLYMSKKKAYRVTLRRSRAAMLFFPVFWTLLKAHFYQGREAFVITPKQFKEALQKTAVEVAGECQGHNLREVRKRLANYLIRKKLV